MYTAMSLAHKIRAFVELPPRYPVILVQGPPRSGKTAMLRAALDALPSARYVDYLQDVMCGHAAPTLGAYAPHDFIDWIITESREAPLLVDEADPLFATWTPEEREIYWRRFLRSESRCPVVVTTRFMEIDPPDKGHGMGLVWRM